MFAVFAVEDIVASFDDFVKDRGAGLREIEENCKSEKC